MTRWPRLRAWVAVHSTRPALLILGLVALAGLLFGPTTVSDVGLVRLVAPISVLLLLPAGAGVAVAVAADNRARLPLPDPPRVAVARAAWILWWTLLAAFTANVGRLTGAHADSAPILRNVVLEATLGLAVVPIGYPHLAWLPPLGYTLVCMMFGYPGNEPRYFWWAVIMQERATPTHWSVCGALYLAVFAVYVVRPPKYRTAD